MSSKPILINYIGAKCLLLYMQENDIYAGVGGHLSEIGTSFDGDSSSSDSDSENEIATRHNEYRGSFRLQTMQTQIQVELCLCIYVSV